VGLWRHVACARRLGPSVEVIDAEGDGLALLDLMEESSMSFYRR
jgi:hypothetical protein